MGGLHVGNLVGPVMSGIKPSPDDLKKGRKGAELFLGLVFLKPSMLFLVSVLYIA
jgi:hypothetical protein